EVRAPSTASLIFDPERETKLLLNKLTPLLRADLEFGFNQLVEELPLHNSHSSHASYQSYPAPDSSRVSLPSDKLLSFLTQTEIRLQEVNQTTFQNLDSALQE